jgi:hypothetical protein
MNFKNKNPPFFYLMAVFIILNIADIVTTMFIIQGESNPIFHLTGSIIPVFVLKIVMIWFIWFMYNRGKFASTMAYYLLIVIVAYASLALGLAQILNINAILHPSVLAQAAAESTNSKVTNYIWFMNLIYMFPIFMSWLTFLIYDKSLKNVSIDREYFKKRKWWKV